MAEGLEFFGFLFQKIVLEYRLITWPLLVGLASAGLIGGMTRSKAGAAVAGVAFGFLTWLSLIILGKAGV